MGTGIAGLDLVQVGERRLVVAPGLDAGEMPARAVGAGYPRALAQRLVGHDAADRALADADRPDRARLRSERGLDLLGRGGARGLLEHLAQLELVQPAIAAHERKPDLAVVGHDGHRLAVVRASTPRKPASPSIVVTPGVSTSATAALGGEEARSMRETAISTFAA